MQAFVNEVLAKSVKNGTMTMYDYVMSDGNRVGNGKFKLKGIEAGDYIQYEIKMNGDFKNFQPGSVSKLDPPAGVAAPAKQANFVPSGDKRQEIISKQAALNSALTLTGILASSDSLPIPKTTKQADRADLILKVVNHYTAIFYNQATGQNMEFDEAVSDSSGDGAMEAAEASDGNWEE